MQPTSMPFSPIKDGRRILGEKDTNACLSPAHQSKQSVSVTGTPVKRTLFTNASPKKLLPSPVFAGQKRTREQLDETDVNNGHVQEPRGLENQSSQSTVNHDAQQLNQGSDAMDLRVPTPSSQPEREHSQDQMETDSPSTASNPSKKETRSIPQDPDARKAFIQQKATILRNTLRNAMRKVTDHQIDRRVSDLEEHSRKQPRLSFPAHSSSPSLPYQKPAMPYQTRTPRIGSTADTSSTPSQQTPDLPAQPSSMFSGSARAKTARTPPRTLGSPMQLSSPPATVRHSRSQTHETGERAQRNAEESASGVLSPSQRGDAVDGLLKLMNTADRHDVLDTSSG